MEKNVILGLMATFSFCAIYGSSTSKQHEEMAKQKASSSPWQPASEEDALVKDTIYDLTEAVNKRQALEKDFLKLEAAMNQAKAAFIKEEIKTQVLSNRVIVELQSAIEAGKLSMKQVMKLVPSLQIALREGASMLKGAHPEALQNIQVIELKDMIATVRPLILACATSLLASAAPSAPVSKIELDNVLAGLNFLQFFPELAGNPQVYVHLFSRIITSPSFNEQACEIISAAGSQVM